MATQFTLLSPHQLHYHLEQLLCWCVELVEYHRDRSSITGNVLMVHVNVQDTWGERLLTATF